MTLIIREAAPDDLAQVHEMIGLLARHHGDAMTITVQDLHNRIFVRQQGCILVAAEEEGLVGYALILTRPNLVTGGAGHDINHLFVVEWRRRAGIGRALIQAARQVSQATGVEYLTIGAQAENHGAITAYRDMGLEEQPLFGVRFKVRLDQAGLPHAAP